MNGLYFCPHCVEFLFNKKKMSDYYGDYLFSSPYVAFLTSKYQKLSEEFMFSSPPGAYLISIYVEAKEIEREMQVFVPSRGISNLNVCVVSYQEDFSEFSSPHGAYLISMTDFEAMALKTVSFRPLTGHI